MSRPAKELERLTLATARVLCAHLADVRTTGAMDLRAELLDELAPFQAGSEEIEGLAALDRDFDAMAPPKPIGGSERELVAFSGDVDALLSRVPFDALLHPDGEFTVSTLAIPQFAVAKTPHRENAEAIANALNLASKARAALREIENLLPVDLEPEALLVDRVRALRELWRELDRANERQRGSIQATRPIVESVARGLSPLERERVLATMRESIAAAFPDAEPPGGDFLADRLREWEATLRAAGFAIVALPPRPRDPPGPVPPRFG